MESITPTFGAACHNGASVVEKHYRVGWLYQKFRPTTLGDETLVH